MRDVNPTAIRRAADRIAPHVRRTPTLTLSHVRGELAWESFDLKLELLQVTGAFKVRGAINKAAELPPNRPLITASGGNHGLGVAYAAHVTGRDCTVLLPIGANPRKVAEIESWGAVTEIVGADWFEANEEAQARAAGRGFAYIHAFADPAVIVGQGTLGLEMAEQSPRCDVVVVPIGGGGLIAGIAVAMKALRPDVRVVGVEPDGAPTLRRALDAGRPVELDRLMTRAGTLAARCTSAINLAIIEQYVDDVLIVTDEEMLEASKWLWSEAHVAAELSGSAATAAVLKGCLRGDRPLAIACGAGVAGMGVP